MNLRVAVGKGKTTGPVVPGAGGITKTNQNVGLDPETLALATPPRDSVDALVDFMKDPTSYDGEYSISDVHPSLRSSSRRGRCSE